jgi:hypothetical protein
MKVEEFIFPAPSTGSVPSLKLAVKRYTPNIVTDECGSSGLTLLLMHGLGQRMFTQSMNRIFGLILRFQTRSNGNPF